MALDFVRDNPGEPVPDETFTHSDLTWSSIIPYLLPPSIAIHGILSVQFTCLTVFFNNLSVNDLYLNMPDTYMHTSRFDEWPGFCFKLLLLSNMYSLRTVGSSARVASH